MNPLDLIYNHSLNVPKDDRPRISEIVEDPLRRMDQNELKYLFSIWNSYLDREQQDINCRGCRAKVVSRLRKMAYIWREKGLISTTSSK
jgi:hypothetical protein